MVPELRKLDPDEEYEVCAGTDEEAWYVSAFRWARKVGKIAFKKYVRGGDLISASEFQQKRWAEEVQIQKLDNQLKILQNQNTLNER
jgi:hypothetical protein